MIKVLHIIESLDAGGAERVLLDLISLNPNTDITHEVLCLAKPGDLEAKFLAQGITLHCLHKSLGFDLRILWRVKKIIELFEPQLLHTHLFSGNLWGRLISVIYGIPCVMGVQNADNWISGWRSLAERCLVDVPLMTLAASQSALEYRQRYGLRLTKGQVINNGVTTTIKPEKRQELRERWGVNKEDRVVGVLARCVPQKNPQLFVEIAKRLIKNNKHIYFVWAGAGSEQDKFKNINPQIKFIGHQEDTMAVLAAFDVLLSTSTREGFSLSLIEGMWAGLPILATAVAGNEEMFQAINPELLVQKEYLENFESRIEAWFMDFEKAKKIGEHLASRVEELFSAESMAAGYQEAYTGLKL